MVFFSGKIKNKYRASNYILSSLSKINTRTKKKNLVLDNWVVIIRKSLYKLEKIGVFILYIKFYICIVCSDVIILSDF